MTKPITSEEERLSFHFSINGGYINSMAIEKLWDENDFLAAAKLIQSATVMPDDTPYVEERHAALILSILDGRNEIKGVYPGKDYGVYPVEDTGRTLSDWFVHIKEKLEDDQRQIKILRDKLACVAQELSETKMAQIDEEWRDGWCDDEDPPQDRTIFGITAQTQIQNTMLDDMLSRMKSEVDEPDYGWLFPDGTFCPVDWGEHQSWAYQWLMDHDPQFAEAQNTSAASRIPPHRAGDYLSEKHKAILLHNPSLGAAYATGLSIDRMTKAQKEWLYDYYQKRGLSEKANDLYKN